MHHVPAGLPARAYALNLKYALGVSKDDQADFDKLYRETDEDLPAAAPAPAAEP